MSETENSFDEIKPVTLTVTPEHPFSLPVNFFHSHYEEGANIIFYHFFKLDIKNFAPCDLFVMTELDHLATPQSRGKAGVIALDQSIDFKSLNLDNPEFHPVKFPVTLFFEFPSLNAREIAGLTVGLQILPTREEIEKALLENVPQPNNRVFMAKPTFPSKIDLERDGKSDVSYGKWAELESTDQLYNFIRGSKIQYPEAKIIPYFPQNPYFFSNRIRAVVGIR